MQGFMGLRTVNQKKPHDTERLRRRERTIPHEELERRSEAKTRILLRNHHDAAPLQSGKTPAGGGSDGRGVAHCVGELMSKKIVALGFDDNLLTVQGIFSKTKLHHLPVVEPGGTIIGIVSDRDLLRRISPFVDTINEQARDREIMTRRVGTIMTRKPICAHAGTTVSDAIRLMDENNISCLPVVEEGGRRLLGIVTWKDMVRSLYPPA